jgi:hypothetical protein
VWAVGERGEVEKDNMPTIELVSVLCKENLTLPSFSTFAIRVDTSLQSHRALFQPVFDQTEGVIVHLGNKDFTEEDYCFFAGRLIDWDEGIIILPEIDSDSPDEQWWGEDQDQQFRFLAEVLPEVRSLLAYLLQHSPCGQVYFSTDYQFGPKNPDYRTGYSIQRLIDEHNEQGLRWNCLYKIDAK